jgi:Tol biopolymer transport system component
MLSSGEINAANLTYPAFSPDGAFLYYLNFITREAASSGGLMRLDLATGTREQLYQAAPGDLLRTFSLSPDAARIVLYIRTVNTEDALFLMPSSGGNARRLYAYPKGEFGRAPGALDWTADGGAILFHHAVGPKDELLRVPLNGAAPDKILTTDQVWSLAVHPDGRHLAWESRSTTVEVFVVDNLFAKASR